MAYLVVILCLLFLLFHAGDGQWRTGRNVFPRRKVLKVVVRLLGHDFAARRLTLTRHLLHQRTCRVENAHLVLVERRRQPQILLMQLLQLLQLLLLNVMQKMGVLVLQHCLQRCRIHHCRLQRRLLVDRIPGLGEQLLLLLLLLLKHLLFLGNSMRREFLRHLVELRFLCHFELGRSIHPA